MAQQSASEFDAPRGTTATELYGEPVAEHVSDGEAFQAFNTDENDERLFVAHYKHNGDEWVKQGMDRHNVQNLFNFDGWPTN